MKHTLFALAVAYGTAFAAHADHHHTELMVAAAQGDTATVRVLIEKGADVNTQGRIGNTALIYAVQEGHADVVKQLLAAGANIDAVNDFRVTAKSLAKGYGHRQIAEQLHHATLQATDEQDDNVL